MGGKLKWHNLKITFSMCVAVGEIIVPTQRWVIKLIASSVVVQWNPCSYIRHMYKYSEECIWWPLGACCIQSWCLLCLQTGRSKGYGFVEFECDEVAKIVAETMDNYLMGERLIKCESFILSSYLSIYLLLPVLSKLILSLRFGRWQVWPIFK